MILYDRGWELHKEKITYTLLHRQMALLTIFSKPVIYVVLLAFLLRAVECKE